MDDVSEPGWYPDPWGTDDERYFDGDTWTRQIRAPGGDATSATAAAVPVAAVPSGAPTHSGGTDMAPPANPAADWYADPWDVARWRWWDGSQWTGFTDRAAGKPSVTAEVEAERRWARWARLAVTLNPVFQIAGLVGAAIQSRWIATNLQELADGTRPPSTAPALSWLSFAGLGVLVVLILWLYRAGSTARTAGRPLRRSPVLGAVSLVIPILNFWWPYRAARDALGHDHPNIRLVARWWALYLTTSLAGVIVLAAGFAPLAVTYVVVAVAAVTAVGSAVLGRSLVSTMLATHETFATPGPTLNS